MNNYHKYHGALWIASFLRALVNVVFTVDSVEAEGTGTVIGRAQVGAGGVVLTRSS